MSQILRLPEKNGPITPIIGLQHGDEGKAKFVDWYLNNAKAKGKPFHSVARYQGGPNAGHTIWIDGVKYVTHQNPSGMFVEGTELITGSDVVFCPEQFIKEYDELLAKGIDIRGLTRISSIAPIRTPWHIQLDCADEHRRNKGGNAIGTTKQGISWVYQDVFGRRQLTVADLLSPKWKNILAEKVSYWESQLFLYSKFDGYGWRSSEVTRQIKSWTSAVKKFRTLFKNQVVSMPYHVNSIIRNGGTILAEGAQGAMLDVNYGEQPNVTSSHPGVAGVLASLGVSSDAIGNVVGVFKAYNTKVGSGNFTSKITDASIAKIIAEKGGEKGATTGRLRDVGWLDLIELSYAIMLNKPNKLCMTKADVLEDISDIGLVTQYKGFKEKLHDLDFRQKYEPVIEYHQMWSGSIAGKTDAMKLPQSFKDFCGNINHHLGIMQPGLEITHIGTGCDRKHTIVLPEYVKWRA
jgi:adenylosuccinate synthase